MIVTPTLAAPVVGGAGTATANLTLGGEVKTVGATEEPPKRHHRREYCRRMLREKLGADSPITLDTHQRRINIPFVGGVPVEVPEAAKPYLRELVERHGYYSQSVIS